MDIVGEMEHGKNAGDRRALRMVYDCRGSERRKGNRVLPNGVSFCNYSKR